ncbi:hypothetical protein [Pseudorhodoplanes sinuspersici]|uniref:Uncharacterized protein n=1 Tax=Pseudorhodoplanes sinuspersici TaxID=1235591 RepID=A0A1W6ZWA0_9HYPH|nr:hypothetical protein [Pseudorhodoplanes sinuspersici]ARQ01709.1 hypothetical protein CAK95_23350 [Pseudorhodoplanes sinuspersici]
MASRLGEIIRESYGSDFVIFDHEDDLDRFTSAIDAFFAGKLDVVSLREKLFELGVPADQIRRLLAGERLLSVSGPSRSETTY